MRSIARQIVMFAAFGTVVSVASEVLAVVGRPPPVSYAEVLAVVGRPLTPVSYAGVARRTVRRSAY